MPPTPATGAGDASVEVLIQSILDRHGFDDFRKAAEETIRRADGMKRSQEGAGAGVEKLAGKTRMAKAEVSVFTARMLQSVGATREAGIAAHVAGVGYEAMAVGLSATSMVFAGGTLALTLILPKLIEYFQRGKDSAEVTAQLRKELLDTLPSMVQYKNAIGELTRLQAGLLKIKQEDALKAQAKQSEDLAKKSAELRKEIAALVEPTKQIDVHSRRSGDATIRWVEASAEARKKAADLAITVADLDVEVAALNEATQRGELLTDSYASAQDRARQKEEERRQSAEKLKKAQDELNAAFREGREAETAGLLAKDSDAIAARERATAHGQLTDEMLERLTVIDEEGIARRKLAEDEARYTEQERRDKRAFNAEMVSTATGSLTALFGKNKAARIAQAMADTYAAANVALATPAPWPAPALFAALAIATGLANVANIRKSELGFDNPVSDLMAEGLGVKFAEDFIRLVRGGFDSRVATAAGGGSSVITNNYVTNHHRNIGSFNARGVIGPNRTSTMKWLRRELFYADRLEDRTTIGARSRR